MPKERVEKKSRVHNDIAKQGERLQIVLVAKPNIFI